MHREYHKWYSPRLGRDMELLVHGHAGLPVIVFPSSQGRFYEFEDRGMIGSIGYKIDNGEVQLYCLDSVDAESWYNRNVPPRWRIARHMTYESYVTEEVLPLVRDKNWNQKRITLGCSFGGYHAVNIALRHPDKFTGFLSMSGAFDLSQVSSRLLRRRCLLQYSAALHCEPWRQLAAGPLSAEFVPLRQRMGRSLSAARTAIWPGCSSPKECRAGWISGTPITATTGPPGSA